MLVEALSELSAIQPEKQAKMLPTALMVCRTSTNRNTGKSPYKLVYRENPHPTTATGPKCKYLSTSRQTTTQCSRGKEKPRAARAYTKATRSHTSLHRQIPSRQKNLGDKLNISKLQSEKKGLRIFIEVRPNNNYLIKGIGSCAK